MALQTVPVKVFKHTDTGMPSLDNTGTYTTTPEFVLGAALIMGFNPKQIVSITRVGTTATVTTLTAHGLNAYDVVEHSGFNETTYNGQFRVDSALGSTQYTVTVSGSPATPATPALQTNLVSAPEDLTDATYIQTGAAVVANAQGAPDGANTMDKLQEDTSTGNHGYYWDYPSVFVGNTYTFSFYAKTAGRPVIALRMVGSGTNDFAIRSHTVLFDLSTGLVAVAGSTGGPSSYFTLVTLPGNLGMAFYSPWTGSAITFVPVGSGIYRVSMTATAAQAGNIRPTVLLTNLSTLTGASGGYSALSPINYTGNGSSGVYVWGHKFEVNTDANPFTPSNYSTTLGAQIVHRAPAWKGNPYGSFYIGSDVSLPNATGKLLRLNGTSNTSNFYGVWVSGLGNVTWGSGPNYSPSGDSIGTSYTWVWRYAYNTATARPYVIIADDRFLYFVRELSTVSYPGAYEIDWFGDIPSFVAGDVYNTVLNGSTATSTGQPNAGNQALQINQNTATNNMIQRDYTGSGATTVSKYVTNPANSTSYLGYAQSNTLAGGTNVADGKVHLAGPVLLYENVSSQPSALRGWMPGLYNPLCKSPGAHLDIYDNIPNLPGRKLLNLATTYGIATSGGRCAIDITGPWR